MKKDSARCPTKDAPQPASNKEVSDNKDNEAIPTPVIVQTGMKRFLVPTGYGGRLKSNQEACDNVWTIRKSRTKEIVECMPNLVKAKAEASAKKSKEYAMFVRVFASWL